MRLCPRLHDIVRARNRAIYKVCACIMGQGILRVTFSIRSESAGKKSLRYCACLPAYSQLQNISLSSSESEAECPDCGLVYGEDESTLIQCDSCGVWRDLVCAGVSSVSDIPEMFCCHNCT